MAGVERTKLLPMLGIVLAGLSKAGENDVGEFGARFGLRTPRASWNELCIFEVCR